MVVAKAASLSFATKILSRALVVRGHERHDALDRSTVARQVCPVQLCPEVCGRCIGDLTRRTIDVVTHTWHGNSLQMR
jgi:hypothetical protein